MRLLPRRLYQRLSLAMATVSLFAVFVVIQGVCSYNDLLESRWRAGLTPEQRDAWDRFEETLVIEDKQVVELYAVFATNLDNLGPVLTLAGGAMLVSGLAGVLVARRICEPVADLARASRRIAAGDLTARTAAVPDASELGGLLRDFNAMADNLERMDRELREAAADIAHELRTPLTILQGRLHGIVDGLFEPTTDEMARLVRQAEHLGGIVDDLRTLTLAQAGKLVLRLNRTDLADIAAQTVEECAPLLDKAGLRAETRLERVEAMLDRGRLRQVLRALLDNAACHAAQGGLIRIETGKREGMACLIVADRGGGLTEEGLARAFERFWREDVSRSRAAGGTGLGLAVVRAVAEAHGGLAMARNNAEGGADFVVRIPLPAPSASRTA